MSDPNNSNANGDIPDFKNLKAKLKAELMQQLKEEIKKDLMVEIYQELQEEGKTPEVSLQKGDKRRTIVDHSSETPAPSTDAEIEVTPEKREDILMTIKAFLKIASHAKKYANEKISQDKWVEVIGLLAGKFENGDESNPLIIEDAYPMGHGNAVYAEIKDYKNFARAFQDLKSKGLFVCGWYHSHPSYGLFLSSEDMGTQARYQKLWDKSLALVVDPYQIDGTSYGFDIFRANLQTGKWYGVPFAFKEKLEKKVLPDLLEFINPVIDGKALFLEYDTMNG